MSNIPSGLSIAVSGSFDPNFGFTVTGDHLLSSAFYPFISGEPSGDARNRIKLHGGYTYKPLSAKSGVQLFFDKFFPYNNGNDEPIYDEESGETLRDPVTGE